MDEKLIAIRSLIPCAADEKEEKTPTQKRDQESVSSPRRIKRKPEEVDCRQTPKTAQPLPSSGSNTDLTASSTGPCDSESAHNSSGDEGAAARITLNINFPPRTRLSFTGPVERPKGCSENCLPINHPAKLGGRGIQEEKFEHEGLGTRDTFLVASLLSTLTGVCNGEG